MNVFITETATQALSTFSISQEQHEMISQLLGSHCLNDSDQTLAKRMLYGVRHGILELV
ncbi:MAG: hypothetical protein F6J87_04410 [Spirulina sp. SIO3F2]|nr:hypothetical protein [Spirulina sp. SIO3F2]